MTAPALPAAPRVDVRAARLSQGLVAALVILAAATRTWPLLVPAAVHLGLSAALGRRGNVAIRFFDAVLRPWLGAPRWEDARPPRFANVVGAIFVGAAVLAHAGGLAALGWALAGVVGVLALVASATGACVGCWLYGYLGPFRVVFRWIG